MVKTKILILCAGRAATQIADIILRKDDVELIGFLDDAEEMQGKKVLGKKVLGKLEKLEKLFKENSFDAIAIGIGSTRKRKEFYNLCKKLNIPMFNTIDPSATICNEVKMGEGNVICGGVYVGNSTILGDNNFISSNGSIEHHSKWGSHITTGPHLSTTGKSKVGDGVSLGMHVGLQYVSVGENSLINSGVILINNVPSNSIVKKKYDYSITPMDNLAEPTSEGWVSKRKNGKK